MDSEQHEPNRSTHGSDGIRAKNQPTCDIISQCEGSRTRNLREKRANGMNPHDIVRCSRDTSQGACNICYPTPCRSRMPPDAQPATPIGIGNSIRVVEVWRGAARRATSPRAVRVESCARLPASRVVRPGAKFTVMRLGGTVNPALISAAHTSGSPSLHSRRCPRRSRRDGSDRRGLGSAMTMAARCRCDGAHCHTESLINMTRTVRYCSTVRPRQSSRPSCNECFAAAAACHPQCRPPIAATAACIRLTSGVNSGSAVAQRDSTRSYHVRASSAKPSFAARSPRCFIIRGASR